MSVGLARYTTSKEYRISHGEYIKEYDGQHGVVYCGDVMFADKYLGGTLDAIVADPPFNIDYKKSSHEYGAEGFELYDDHKTEADYLKFTTDWMRVALNCLRDWGTLWVAMAPDNRITLETAIAQLHCDVIARIVWAFKWGVFAKYAPSKCFYDIYQLVKLPKRRKKGKVARYKHTFVRQRKEECSFWYDREYNRGDDPDRVELHPTQLPFFVYSKMIALSTNEGDSVGGWFSGSGGDLLACRVLKRRAYCIEKNPSFIPVILRKGKVTIPDLRKFMGGKK